jgi:hypothetical protein
MAPPLQAPQALAEAPSPPELAVGLLLLELRPRKALAAAAAWLRDLLGALLPLVLVVLLVLCHPIASKLWWVCACAASQLDGFVTTCCRFASCFLLNHPGLRAEGRCGCGADCTG